MAEKKKTLVDYGMDLLRTMLSDKPQVEAPLKKARLEDLQLDDLRREKIRLDQEERKMLARLKEVEKQKRQLFQEGVQNASEREQRVIARRIKEADVEAANMDNMLRMISKQMRVLNGLTQLKERSRLAAESGLNSIVSSIDLQELIMYIDKASVDGEFNLGKFDDVLNALEEADSLSPEYREDGDVQEIMRAMQQAREAADSPEAIEERYTEMERQMETKNRTANLEANEEDV